MRGQGGKQISVRQCHDHGLGIHYSNPRKLGYHCYWVTLFHLDQARTHLIHKCQKKKNHVFCILQLLKVIGLFDALYTHLDNLETALKMDSNILIKRSNLVNFLDKEFKISCVSIKCM